MFSSLMASQCMRSVSKQVFVAWLVDFDPLDLGPNLSLGCYSKKSEVSLTGYMYGVVLPLVLVKAVHA